MVWFGLSSKVYTMKVDRREKSLEQSTNTILNPSARSEDTFFVNCPVADMSANLKKIRCCLGVELMRELVH